MYFEPSLIFHRFLISEWNVNQRIHEKLPRSNCSIESLHRTVYKTIGHANPTIWELIGRLQNEEASARLKMSQSERGDTPKQKKVYKDLTERIENLVENYEDWKKSNRRITFLEKISLNLKTVETIPDNDELLDEDEDIESQE